MLFDHEKLDVYRISLEFSRFVADLIDKLQKVHHCLKDQLVRASLSIPLNIAEGNGKRAVTDRKRFFEIARGSAMECAAILDVFTVYYEDSTQEILKGKSLLFRIVSMLSRMTEPTDTAVREADAEYAPLYSAVLDYEHEHEQEHE